MTSSKKKKSEINLHGETWSLFLALCSHNVLRVFVMFLFIRLERGDAHTRHQNVSARAVVWPGCRQLFLIAEPKVQRVWSLT